MWNHHAETGSKQWRGHEALVVCLIACGLAGWTPAYAQTYPNKAIRIVTAPVGGASDFSARILAQGLSSSLGQQVIVDNRSGGSGIIAAQLVAKSPPDGYTLILYTSPLWLLPLLQDNVPYDPVRDFLPISLTDRSPGVLAVHPSLPVNSVRALIRLAKSKPGQLNYSRASAGGTAHLSAELFKSMAAVDIVPVPYKGGGAAVIALVSGEVELTFASAGSISAPLKQKRLRALAVTSAQPSSLFPGIPTLAASGLAGYESVLVNGMFAPAGTPAAIINRLSQEVANIQSRPDVKERFLISGVETAGTSPGELESTVKTDIVKWGKLIREAKLRAN